MKSLLKRIATVEGDNLKKVLEDVDDLMRLGWEPVGAIQMVPRVDDGVVGYEYLATLVLKTPIRT